MTVPASTAAGEAPPRGSRGVTSTKSSRWNLRIPAPPAPRGDRPDSRRWRGCAGAIQHVKLGLPRQPISTCLQGLLRYACPELGQEASRFGREAFETGDLVTKSSLTAQPFLCFTNSPLCLTLLEFDFL